MTTIRETKKELVIKALVKHMGNRTKAARELGVCIRTIRNLIRDFKINIPPPPEFKTQYSKGKAIGELNKIESALVVLSQGVPDETAARVIEVLESVKTANNYLKSSEKSYVEYD